MDNLITAGLYTVLTAIVAFYYWMEGHKKGVTETLSVFHYHEPDALKRVQTKLRQELQSVSDS
jgi:hypothetical protein